MAGSNMVRSGSSAASSYGGAGRAEPLNLGDILERVLDKGLVIAGDIRVNLLDIELLTIKLRLVIASLETAREVGINWWETDPWLNANAARRSGDRQVGSSPDGDDPRGRELEDENRQLRERIEELESGESGKSGRSSRD
jgi:hypothetical protein